MQRLNRETEFSRLHFEAHIFGGASTSTLISKTKTPPVSGAAFSFQL
jgi:hypothetical protein